MLEFRRLKLYFKRSVSKTEFYLYALVLFHEHIIMENVCCMRMEVVINKYMGLYAGKLIRGRVVFSVERVQYHEVG